MKLSFVIACYKSQNTIEVVLEELIEKVNEKPNYEYEIIVVNDCSPDNVLEVLQKNAEQNDRIKVIDLAKNFGQHAAMMAGASYTSGDYVIFLDDDFQCPVNNLWELLKPLDEGYDMSFAQYPLEKRKASIFRIAGSWFNDLMMQIMLDKPKDVHITNFMAVKQFVISEIINYRNPYPYVDGLLFRTSKNIALVEMEDRERLSGKSTYKFSTLVKLFVNGFTAFSIKPLRVATFIGTVCSFSGFIYMIYIIISRLVRTDIDAGYSSLMAVILFIGGIIMLLLGICGEYIGRIYISINNSPQYVVKKTYNVDK